MLEPIYPPRVITDSSAVPVSVARFVRALAGACLWQALGLELPDDYRFAAIPPDQLAGIADFVFGIGEEAGALAPSLDLGASRFVFEFDTADPEIVHYEVGTGSLLRAASESSTEIGFRWGLDVRRRSGAIVESAFVELDVM